MSTDLIAERKLRPPLKRHHHILARSNIPHIIVRAERGIRALRSALTTSPILARWNAMASLDLITSKKCSACDNFKSLESFSIHAMGALGRRSRCKECVKTAERAARRAAWEVSHRRDFSPSTSIIDSEGRDWAWAFVAFSDVADFPGYKVSSDGWLWSCWGSGYSARAMTDRWKKLKPSRGKDGYLRVTLCRDSQRHYRGLHALVLAAFMGPCPPGMECCHGNGSRGDNRILNLRWDTRTANAADRARHGKPRKPRRGASKSNHSGQGKVKQRRTEVVWMNYEPEGLAS